MTPDAGADRIVNAVAAYARSIPRASSSTSGPRHLRFVTARGEYAGASPGAAIATERSLSHGKLPRVDVARPDGVIGRSTVESIQSGVYFGYVALVDGLVRRMKEAMKADPIHVVATGGLAASIARDATTVDAVDENLTLEGLRLLYALNR